MDSWIVWMDSRSGMMVGKMEAIMLLLSRRSNFTRRKMKSRLMPNTWGANIQEL